MTTITYGACDRCRWADVMSAHDGVPPDKCVRYLLDVERPCGGALVALPDQDAARAAIALGGWRAVDEMAPK